jgi:anti-sigma factor RsiW
MKECLREEVLQSYLDGELQGRQLEQVTFHLSSCSSCANLSRQLEQENNILATALAPEFDSVVPSERLRQRIDSAIAADRIAAVSRSANARGWLSSLSDLFAFRPQRALGYASLILIVGFGLIMAMMRWQMTTAPTSDRLVAVDTHRNENPKATTASPDKEAAPDVKPIEQAKPDEAKPDEVKPDEVKPDEVKPANVERPANRRRVPVQMPRLSDTLANHVKLLPGERSYLQTIAQLDSSINADKSRMKPEVQAEYQRNLAVVDRTLAVARTAAKSNPNDPDAAEFMFSAYQSKVDLLNTVAEARVFEKQH